MVSLVIPCYNMESFISRCIDSVLAQTHPDIQLIVVNDGSTDKSEEILEQRRTEIEKKVTEYIYINQPNGGVAAACCNGFKKATGKYLILLDSDDALLPESIQKQHDYLEEHTDYALVRTNGWYVNEEDNGQNERPFTEKTYCGVLFDDLMVGKSYNWPGSYMIRMSVLDEIYPDRNIYLTRGGQNLQFLMASAYKRKCGFILDPLMKYTIRTNSLSHFSEEYGRKQTQALLNYKDIREHVIDSIVEASEREKYHFIIDMTYARIFMGHAIDIKDCEMLKENFAWLKKNGFATIGDNITYYNEVSPLVGLYYRLVNKIKRLFH